MTPKEIMDELGKLYDELSQKYFEARVNWDTFGEIGEPAATAHFRAEFNAYGHSRERVQKLYLQVKESV